MDNNINQAYQDPSSQSPYPPGAARPLPQLGPGAAPEPLPSDEMTPEQKKTLISIIIAIVVIVVIVVGGIVYLAFFASAERTAQIRDIFIIVMALQSLLIGAVLVILIVQVARLINLLQNEIKPILDSTNETISYLRGTSVFLSENLTEPVIKLNEYLAGLTQLLQVVGLVRRSSRPKPPKGT